MDSGLFGMYKKLPSSFQTAFQKDYILFCIPTSSVWGLQLFCILVTT